MMRWLVILITLAPSLASAQLPYQFPANPGTAGFFRFDCAQQAPFPFNPNVEILEAHLQCQCASPYIDGVAYGASDKKPAYALWMHGRVTHQQTTVWVKDVWFVAVFEINVREGWVRVFGATSAERARLASAYGDTLSYQGASFGPPYQGPVGGDWDHDPFSGQEVQLQDNVTGSVGCPLGNMAEYVASGKKITPMPAKWAHCDPFGTLGIQPSDFEPSVDESLCERFEDMIRDQSDYVLGWYYRVSWHYEEKYLWCGANSRHGGTFNSVDNGFSSWVGENSIQVQTFPTPTARYSPHYICVDNHEFWASHVLRYQELRDEAASWWIPGLTIQHHQQWHGLPAQYVCGYAEPPQYYWEPSRLWTLRKGPVQQWEIFGMSATQVFWEWLKGEICIFRLLSVPGEIETSHVEHDFAIPLGDDATIEVTWYSDFSHYDHMSMTIFVVFVRSMASIAFVYYFVVSIWRVVT